MASLAELARQHTDLSFHDIAHLQRLIGSWGLLADFCFADLLLFGAVGDRTVGGADTDAPVGPPIEQVVVLGQIRPTTSQTVWRSDLIGSVLAAAERPVVARSFTGGELLEGELVPSAQREVVRVQGIPVRYEGRVIAVLSRDSAPTFGRQPGALERNYVSIFNRFARMIVTGEFPFVEEDLETDAVPRVGDGVLLLDGQMRVEFSSPNAVSALHRLGVHANSEGMRLGDLGMDDHAVQAAFAKRMPVSREFERGPEVTVALRCIPLVVEGRTTGAVVLLRDVSELRRRDRLLLSKDATIREIHHRVKNNLQTISSLLRLQGRRLESPEAKAAIEESVRRVRSIALVHEILSREAGEDVPFIDIVRDLTRMAEEAFSDPDRPIRCAVEGDPGLLPAQVATPLAVVLNELLQNTADHAFPAGEGGGVVTLRFARKPRELRVEIVDDGVGLPEAFALDQATGLGLMIVRTLMISELAGDIIVEPAGEPGRAGGTTVRLTVPVPTEPS